MVLRTVAPVLVRTVRTTAPAGSGDFLLGVEVLPNLLFGMAKVDSLISAFFG